jgi:hypothetical protein
VKSAPKPVALLAAIVGAGAVLAVTAVVVVDVVLTDLLHGDRFGWFVVFGGPLLLMLILFPPTLVGIVIYRKLSRSRAAAAGDQSPPSL